MEQKREDGALVVIALLVDRPHENLARGQVGTIVERLGEKAALVEFNDGDGRAYAVASVSLSDLLVFHHAPVAA